MRSKDRWFALTGLFATVLACSLPAGRSPAQPPDLIGTVTARAGVLAQSSYVPALTITPPATETAAFSPTETITATPSTAHANLISAGDCRAGPGPTYALLATVLPGQTAEIVGKDTADSYWLLRLPRGSTCWFWAPYTTVNGNLNAVPEVPPPATPVPSLPADPTALQAAYRCSLSSSPFLHNEVHLEITWQDNAANEAGYYVFRDGTLLAALPAGTTSFSDDTTMAAFAPTGQPKPQITYSVQAFNSAGRSAKVSKSISCFG